MLAVTVSLTPQGIVHFIGDDAPDALQLSVEAGVLRYTGASPADDVLNIPLADVTSLIIELGAGDGDSVEFGGDAAFALNQGQLTLANVESIVMSQSIHSAGDQEYSGDLIIAGDAIVLSADGNMSLVGSINSQAAAEAAPLASNAFGEMALSGHDLLTWQQSLGADVAHSAGGQGFLVWQRSLGAPASVGDFNNDGLVDGADLDVWRQSSFAPAHSAALTGRAGLTINVSGQLHLQANVGNVTPLGSLTVAAASVLLGGSLTLDGNSTTFNSPVILTADVVIADSGDVTFNSTVDSDGVDNWDLAVNSPGATTFNGAVGGTAPLGELTTDPGGQTLLGANITTTGDQTYNDAVTLASNVVLTGDDIAFNAEVDGAFDLVINTATAAGVTTFNAPVGAVVALRNLSTNAPGTTILNGLSITTTEDQTYNDAVTLASNVVLTGDDITFNAAVDGPFDLVINTATAAGVTTFNAPVGAGAALRNLSTNAPGTTVLNGLSVATIEDQIYQDAVTLADNGVLSGDDVLFVNTVNGPFALAVNGAGQTQFNMAVGATTPLMSLTVNAGGETLLAANISTTEDQTYQDVVTLAGNVVLTGDDVQFLNTVNGPFSLAVNGTGQTLFNMAVGVIAPLFDLAVNAGGQTILSADIIAIQDQIYHDAVTLAGNVALSGDDITFNAAVDGPFDLTINTATAAGVTTFNAPVGAGAALRNLATNAPGATILNGMWVATTQDQVYSDAVTLGNSSLLTGNDVRFLATVDGAFALAVNASGQTQFNMAVGAATPLTNLTTDPGGQTLLGANITTTGDQTYNDAVTLASNVVLTGDDITFNAGVDGPFDLVINTATATGVTTFNAPVGAVAALRNLSTNAPGATVLNGLSIITTEDQTYNDAATLISNAALQGEDIAFAAAIDSSGGARDLVVDAAQSAFFGGPIGQAQPLRDLIVRTGGPLAGPLTLGVAATVTRDILLDVRESDPTFAADNIVLTPAAQMTAGRNVRLRAGDGISLNSGATIAAAGTLILAGDFGDNDSFGTTVTTTTPMADAVGALQGVLGIEIYGGDDSPDVFNLQAERLITPNTVLINGYLATPLASGADEFMLVLADNSNLSANRMVINGGDESGSDRLTVDHSKDSSSRKVTVQYAVNYPGDTTATSLDGSASRFVGYGAAAGFSATGMDAYTLRAGDDDHDHIAILANNQVYPADFSGGFAALEQAIKVTDDPLDADTQWQLLDWNSGQLIGSNVRDVILNDSSIPMLLQGGPGNDTIVGGDSIDVVFGGGGAPFFNVGAADMLLTPAMFPSIAPADTLVRRGDYLVGRGGDDFLFADVDLYRDGATLWGLVTLDLPGESDVIDGAIPGTASLAETNHGAQFGVLDIVRNITGMLIDGGAVKDVSTWLRASPMLANLNPNLTSDSLNMLIDAAFRANDPGIGKVGLLSPPFNALLDDFQIAQQTLPPPAAMALTTAALLAAPAGNPGLPTAPTEAGSSAGDPSSQHASSRSARPNGFRPIARSGRGLDAQDAALALWP